MMLEIEKNENVIFKGNKVECIDFLNKNGARVQEDDPLLLVANIATMHGFSIYIRGDLWWIIHIE